MDCALLRGTKAFLCKVIQANVYVKGFTINFNGDLYNLLFYMLTEAIVSQITTTPYNGIVGVVCVKHPVRGFHIAGKRESHHKLGFSAVSIFGSG